MQTNFQTHTLSADNIRLVFITTYLQKRVRRDYLKAQQKRLFYVDEIIHIKWVTLWSASSFSISYPRNLGKCAQCLCTPFMRQNLQFQHFYHQCSNLKIQQCFANVKIGSGISWQNAMQVVYKLFVKLWDWKSCPNRLGVSKCPSPNRCSYGYIGYLANQEC